MMFSRLVALYGQFVNDNLHAHKLLDEFYKLSKKFGFLDPSLEEMINKAYASSCPVAVELVKEVFHTRLRKVPKEELGGADAARLFDGIVFRVGR